MKQKEKKSKLVKVPEEGLLALVASQLKGKTLFPQKMEDARKILKHAKIVKK